MASLKYFDKIRELQEQDAKLPPGPRPPFDFASLATKSRLTRDITRFVLRRLLPIVAAILRTVWPNPRFGRIIVTTRRADVRQVLADMDRFKVVYGPEMKELGGRADNVLSVDGDDHDRRLAILKASLTAADVASIREWVREDAQELLRAGGGRIDVMRDLITRTATEAACRLFGITAHDPDALAEQTMAVSNQLFADYFGDRNVRTQAQTGAAYLGAAIDDAIARARRNPGTNRDHANVIDRLINVHGVPPEEVRASIVGLITAFVPTNTLAAGNMLEELFSRRSLMRRAQRAARDGDRAGLRDALLEAGRRNPALSPGVWRHLPAEGAEAVIGKGWRRRRVKPGDLVLVCIPSALRDRRGDKAANKAARTRLMFGHGPHYCAGDELAVAHLVSVFEQLLKLDDLALAPGRDGKMFRTGPYPTRLDMTYRANSARRSHIILTFTVREGVAREDVKAALERLGNPVREDVRDSLDRTGRVQFASLSVIERAPDSASSVLIVEISGDGEDDELLDRIAEHCLGWLRPILALCSPDIHEASDADALSRVLKSGRRSLHQWPWGSTGLHFDGLAELSVADIERQDRVSAFAAGIVQEQLSRDLGLSTRAMDMLLRARRLLKRDSFLALRRDNQERLRAAPERGAIIKPSRKRLAIADWTPPGHLLTPFPKMLLAPDNRLVPAVLLIILAAWSAGLLIWLLPVAGAWPVVVAAVLACLVGGALMTLLTVAGLAALFLWGVRRKEKADPADEQTAGLKHVKEVTRREDAPGHAQNHIIAVMPFKPGLLRRLSFAYAMWGIKQAVSYWFRPGFVVTMGTIHKARWFRVPGTDQFVFLSNFDGSWESYLEDFITRANEGQSAAWSHGVGFPRTRFLILDGAEDGDSFKRWVRRQQRPTLCWYSRFPNLTAQQIRRNAMIEDGLARATNDTDARRWLSHFGSAQRERDELETHEAQTLIFSGFPRQLEATALFVRLPDDRDKRTAWLEAVSGLRAMPIPAMIGPPARWLKSDFGRRYIQLPRDARIRFGEHVVEHGGAALAFTSSGLERAGLSDESGLQDLPAPFRLTMAGRAATLGDDPDALPNWRFSDHPERSDAAQAVLLLYGHESEPDPLTHGQLVDGHVDLLNYYMGSVCHRVPCTALDGRLDLEHFGFRDGISQPVIRGTRRAAHDVPDRDMVPAGEFLLGYRNMQGFVSPPIAIGPEYDPACDLSTAAAADSNRYPHFGSRGAAVEPRDFGRNGCFLAVRQLDQDVKGFWNEIESVADSLSGDYRSIAEVTGAVLSPDWLAAKVIGRWKDGSPMVGYADRAGEIEPGGSAPNDFAYGVDDSRGLACPLGSHIRRANPRDSQEPGDPDEQRITNRHRLLRRGRSYAYEADGDGAGTRTGLLFMALCADLERQFEFVQRSWLNATSFHGLVDERDPLLGGAAPRTPGGAATDEEGGFTIPTAAGPVRIPALKSAVKLRGGGYFFLPSRSALAFLINRSKRIG